MISITLNGTNSNDVIQPSDIIIDGVVQVVDFFIFADAGDDVVTTGVGSDFIDAGDGNDTVIAGKGDDFVLGGFGDDILHGQNGNDSLIGGWGDDVLFGGAKDDYLTGGHGNDSIYGGTGNDEILGLKGHNDLYGGDGEDYISTGDHTSTVDGGSGDDVINIRMKKGGDHTLTGGEGTDVFEFVHASLKKVTDAVITDFEIGVDLITIDGVDAVQLYLDDGFLSVEDSVDGVVLTLVSNDTITLNGITVAELEAAYLV